VERGEGARNGALRAIAIAWLITSIFYSYQYVLRSAPAVMVPQLTDAFAVTSAGLAALVGLFYWGYAPFSLVAGVAMDQLGPRRVVPVGAAIVGAGALLFATGDANLASVGRFLQGVGGVFALIGAAYIATTYFPASRAATLIGATQMFGMAGGSAGQFLVGPVIVAGLVWSQFWWLMGAAGLAIAALLLLFIPRTQPQAASAPERGNWAVRAFIAIGAVFRNPQSILCGLIAGLMFLPTTIFDMVWGVRFLQEAHDVPYSMAVLRSASVPFGWIIGCPLLGMLSDRLGRRKPVIIGGAVVLLACMALILYGPAGVFPPFVLGLVTGIASGAAMIPYTVIKEANRPEHGGTATGVINFINFSLSALLGPVFGTVLAQASGGGERELEHYQTTFQPLVWGVGLAIVLALLLRETGAGARSFRALVNGAKSRASG
jgi:MFS family permease